MPLMLCVYARRAPTFRATASPDAELWGAFVTSLRALSFWAVRGNATKTPVQSPLLHEDLSFTSLPSNTLGCAALLDLRTPSRP